MYGLWWQLDQARLFPFQHWTKCPLITFLCNVRRLDSLHAQRHRRGRNKYESTVLSSSLCQGIFLFLLLLRECLYAKHICWSVCRNISKTSR
jgi:hypothetical protein